jgi:hypothetical protein
VLRRSRNRSRPATSAKAALKGCATTIGVDATPRAARVRRDLPDRAGNATTVSGELLRSRPSAPPGHSIIDLVDTLPGWFETSSGSWRFDSGLPIEIERPVDEAALAQQYGAAVDRVDFARGRLRSASSVDGSVAVGLWKTPARSVRLQVDVFNVADRLNVINFASLLSGTALGRGRSLTARLRAEF